MELTYFQWFSQTKRSKIWTLLQLIAMENGTKYYIFPSDKKVCQTLKLYFSILFWLYFAAHKSLLWFSSRLTTKKSSSNYQKNSCWNILIAMQSLKIIYWLKLSKSQTFYMLDYYFLHLYVKSVIIDPSIE